MSRAVPADTQAHMEELYQTGLSIREVAQATYWSVSTVHKVLTARGVQTRPRGGIEHQRLADQEIQLTIELYESGLTMQQVADRLGRSRTSIQARLRRYGSKPRSHMENVQVRLSSEAPGWGCMRAQTLRMLREHGPMTNGQLYRLVGRDHNNTWRDLQALVRYGAVAVDREGRHPVYRYVGEVREPRKPRGRFSDELLPIGPFREWVRNLMDRLVREESFVGAEGVHRELGGRTGSQLVAEKLGVSSRVVWRWLYESREIGVESADAALVASREAVFLWDLWPERFGDDEQAAA